MWLCDRCALVEGKGALVWQVLASSHRLRGMGRQHVGDVSFGGEDLTCNSDDLQLPGMGKAAQCPGCELAMQEFGSLLEGIQSRERWHDEAPAETRLVPDELPHPHTLCGPLSPPA